MNEFSSSCAFLSLVLGDIGDTVFTGDIGDTVLCCKLVNKFVHTHSGERHSFALEIGAQVVSLLSTPSILIPRIKTHWLRYLWLNIFG